MTTLPLTEIRGRIESENNIARWLTMHTFGYGGIQTGLLYGVDNAIVFA